MRQREIISVENNTGMIWPKNKDADRERSKSLPKKFHIAKSGGRTFQVRLWGGELQVAEGQEEPTVTNWAQTVQMRKAGNGLRASGVPPQWDFDFMWGASGGFTGDGWEKRLWQQRSGRTAEYEVHPVRSYTKSYSLNRELDSKSKCVTSVRFGCSVYSRDFLTVFMHSPHLLVSFLIQED